MVADRLSVFCPSFSKVANVYFFVILLNKSSHQARSARKVGVPPENELEVVHHHSVL